MNTLDPQYAVGEDIDDIIINTMEGLFMLNEEGKAVLSVAEHYEVSDAGKLYTINLRQDTLWSDGSSVVAADFEFAIERMFHPQAISPNAELYSEIKNAEKVLSGELSVSDLGIEAVDEYTLQIELENPNPYFINTLTLPSAVPCKQSFLENSRGRYGLDSENMLFNGPFVVDYWDEDLVSIVKNDAYHDAENVLPSKVIFYTDISEENTRFTAGTTDAVLMLYEEFNESEKSDGITTEIMENTLWAMTYNQKNFYFDYKEVREAFSYALTNSKEELPNLEGYALTDEIHSSSDEEENVEYLYPIDQTPLELMKESYTMHEIEGTPKLTLMLPDNQMGNSIATNIQKIWGEELSVFINFEFLSENELISKVNSGDYDMAVYPYYFKGDSAEVLLTTFSNAGTNPPSYLNEEYNSLIAEASAKANAEEQNSLLNEAEQMLISDSVIYPLYIGSSVFVTAETVKDVKALDFGNTIYFKYAVKE